ncbi:MAG TPA: hypothetical protein VEC12_04270 [Bacteroidia bacterium]|nr:hypothetical protein [Bacteroidia bacterium]
MRTVLIITLTLLCSVLVQGQSGGGNLEIQYNAQNTAKYIQVSHNPANIKQLEYQREAWQKVVQAEPSSAVYWFNYYMAARLYYLQTNGGRVDSTGKRELTAIAVGMDTSVRAEANLFEQLMIKYFEAPTYKQATIYLEKAIEKAPYNSFLQTELPKYYYLINEADKRNTALSNVREVSGTTALYGFCRAMVHSLPDSSIIITNGDYDTYATWLGSMTTRKKLAVISIKWLEDEGMRERMLNDAGLKLSGYKKEDVAEQLIKQNPGKKIMFSLTVNPGYLNGINKSLYNTGFCYQYSAKPFDNIEVLYNNLVTFRTEIYKPIGSSEVLKNCMPGFITLFRYYKDTDKERAEETAREARKIAEKGGFWNEYSSYFK